MLRLNKFSRPEDPPLQLCTKVVAARASFTLLFSVRLSSRTPFQLFWSRLLALFIRTFLIASTGNINALQSATNQEHLHVGCLSR